MPGLVVRNIEEDESLEITIAVEDLDAPVPTVCDVDVVLPVDSDIVGSVELAGILVRMRAAYASRSPRFDPVAVFVEFRHSRINVAVADVDVVVTIKGHVGRGPEHSVHVFLRWPRFPTPPQAVAPIVI